LQQEQWNGTVEQRFFNDLLVATDGVMALLALIWIEENECDCPSEVEYDGSEAA